MNAIDISLLIVGVTLAAIALVASSIGVWLILGV